MPKTVQQKREEAEARQLVRSSRSIQDQMKLLEARRGNSTEERHNLLRQLENSGDA